MQSPPGLVNQAVTSAMLSQYNRADEAPVRVSQYNVMLSSTWSGLRIFQSALVVTRPTPSPGSRHRVRPVSRPGSIRVSEALLPESGNMPTCVVTVLKPRDRRPFQLAQRRSPGWRRHQRRDQMEAEETGAMVQRQASRDTRAPIAAERMNREYPSRSMSSAQAAAIR
jgi:hypothetical protein